MSTPEEKLIPGAKYTKEEIENLGLEIKKKAHVGLICRKDNFLYFFDEKSPLDGKGYIFIKALED